MKASPVPFVLLAVVSMTLPGCFEQQVGEHHHEEHHKVVVSSPEERDVTITQQYVCQIRSCRHIDVCALESGYLEEIAVKEGQMVKQGAVMFKIVPTLYQAKLETEQAEAHLAEIEYNNTKRLLEQNVVSPQELALAQAKLDKALAQVKLAQAELNFTFVKAPFDGIVDRLHEQKGSLVAEGDDLTTLSDNGVMWVYFNVPEERYLEYMANRKHAEVGAKDDDDDDDDEEEDDDETQIELVLANGEKFPQAGKIGAIEADFNNETGNIAFRADFPNPDGLLRNGQTGNILINRTLDDAIVIPQRATFEILDKRYVYIVDEENTVHQREIVVKNELDDIFVIKDGIDEDAKFVLEGIRQVHDGEKVEYEFLAPDEVLGALKNRAE